MLKLKSTSYFCMYLRPVIIIFPSKCLYLFSFIYNFLGFQQAAEDKDLLRFETIKPNEQVLYLLYDYRAKLPKQKSCRGISILFLNCLKLIFFYNHNLQKQWNRELEQKYFPSYPFASYLWMNMVFCTNIHIVL